MLCLFVSVPLRQRNLREMPLRKNLHQDPESRWHLAFTGEELKIGRRRGRSNTFQLCLSRARPLLPHAETDPHVWLTNVGRPYTADVFSTELWVAVDRSLGKAFYPHLICTLWATGSIAATGDPTTAAYMLNDRVGTVLRRD